MNIPYSVFKKQLIHWTGHTMICAAPSFVLAVTTGFSTKGMIFAMLAGIATMILLYSLVSSHSRFSNQPGGILSRAARYGARTRSITCLLEVPLFVSFCPLGAMLLMPDVLGGIAALYLVGLKPMSDHSHVTQSTLLQVYAATVVEALLVSGTIFAAFVMGVWFVDAIRRFVSPRKTSTQTSEVTS